jgi:hypothetical protein
MSVPSLVSINNRGPLSATGSGAGLVTPRAMVFLVERLLGVAGLLSELGFTSGLSVAVASGLTDGVGRVVRVAGRLPRRVPGVGRAGVVLATSAGVSSGVGDGVGTAATSVGGGVGSSILAPVAETRLPVVLRALAEFRNSLRAFSASTNGPLVIG